MSFRTNIPAVDSEIGVQLANRIGVSIQAYNSTLQALATTSISTASTNANGVFGSTDGSTVTFITSPSFSTLKVGSLSGVVKATSGNLSGGASASDLSNGVSGSGAVVLAASPALTGIPTAPTASSTDSSTQIATTAFCQSIVGTAVTSAMVYKGTVDITAAPPSPEQTGWCWRVATGGTPNAGYSFTSTVTTCNIGDLVVYNGTTWDHLTSGLSAVNSGDNIVVTPTGNLSYSVALTSSPALSGNPTAPTPSSTDNSTRIATTAFVHGLNLVANTLSLQAVTLVTASGSYTATSSDYLIIVNKTASEATTINLPAGTDNRVFLIKDGKGDASTHNITITVNSTDKIMDTALSGLGGSTVIQYNGESVTLVYKSGVWYLI